MHKKNKKKQLAELQDNEKLGKVCFCWSALTFVLNLFNGVQITSERQSDAAERAWALKSND